MLPLLLSGAVYFPLAVQSSLYTFLLLCKACSTYPHAVKLGYLVKVRSVGRRGTVVMVLAILCATANKLGF